MQLIPCSQRKSNCLVTSSAFGLSRLVILLEPACAPIPCQCLGAEPGHYVMEKFSAIMLVLGAGPAREHKTPKKHAWEEVRSARQSAQKCHGLRASIGKLRFRSHVLRGIPGATVCLEQRAHCSIKVAVVGRIIQDEGPQPNTVSISCLMTGGLCRVACRN